VALQTPIIVLPGAWSAVARGNIMAADEHIWERRARLAAIRSSARRVGGRWVVSRKKLLTAISGDEATQLRAM
jgi:hypothetical protein